MMHYNDLTTIKQPLHKRGHEANHQERPAARATFCHCRVQRAFRPAVFRIGTSSLGLIGMRACDGAQFAFPSALKKAGLSDIAALYEYELSFP